MRTLLCFYGVRWITPEDKGMYYCYLETPIGSLLLAGDDNGLAIVGFPEGSGRVEPDPDWIFNEKWS